MSPDGAERTTTTKKKHTVNTLLEGAKTKAEPLEVPRGP